MIDISKISTYGWEAAVRGMRNSRQSWEKSDSEFGADNNVILGPNDLELAKSLAKAGGSHAKFRRMIGVSMDILAPLYWWKEFDTYKVGTVANSTSTMYSIMKKEFTIYDFSHSSDTSMMSAKAGMHLLATIDVLNDLRQKYLEADNENFKRIYWYDTIQTLPCSYNQLRTVSMNYEVVAHIIKERKNHKLDEWRKFCSKLFNALPYSMELIDIPEDCE